MEVFKIYVNDRNYTGWTIYETSNFQNVELTINPIEEKLFSNDVFKIHSGGKVEILHSTIRSTSTIPAVLVLTGNKTYGRQLSNEDGNKSGNKKAGKLLYKCIPDDMRLPSFLVPYEIKQMGFSKVFVNLYVTISFNHWQNKHPYGLLSNVIGPVDVLDNYYEYQLYCRSLNASIQKFQKDTSKALQTKSNDAFISSIREKYPCIEDRTNQKDWFIFTIDPIKSVDLDDGFSIKSLDNGIEQLSIYISNVTIWMDVLNLWESFSRRISTIYLPDRKRPMLPTILSDCLCSLLSNHTRIAFVMDIFIKDDEIIDIKYLNTMVKVNKNYYYEEPSLLENENYKSLIAVTKRLSKKYKYVNNVRNSHDLVCYLMILMNYNTAKELIQSKTGIFRSTIMKRDVSIPENLSEDVAKFVKIWNSSCGQYIDGSNLNSDIDIRHDLLDMDAYIHITSPIRRLVDLLNIIKFQQITGMITLSQSSEQFYKNWLTDLEYINITMRSIRKVQTDCSLLELCVNNPAIMEKEYDGYMFDKILRNDGLFQYIVFIPEIKMGSRVTLRENFENYDSKKFKIFIFNDEESFKKKIRLHMV